MFMLSVTTWLLHVLNRYLADWTLRFQRGHAHRGQVPQVRLGSPYVAMVVWHGRAATGQVVPLLPMGTPPLRLPQGPGHFDRC